MTRFARPRAKGLIKHWHTVTAPAQTGVGTTQIIIASFLPLEGDRPETVLRARGEVVAVATPNAASDADVLGLGLPRDTSNRRRDQTL